MLEVGSSLFSVLDSAVLDVVVLSPWVDPPVVVSIPLLELSPVPQAPLVAQGKLHVFSFWSQTVPSPQLNSYFM